MSDETKTQEPYWKGKGYSFFCNRACEYFCSATALSTPWDPTAGEISPIPRAV